jgi:hypothetical protein
MAAAADDPLWPPGYFGLTFLIWCKKAEGIWLQQNLTAGGYTVKQLFILCDVWLFLQGQVSPFVCILLFAAVPIAHSSCIRFKTTGSTCCMGYNPISYQAGHFEMDASTY